MALPPDTPAEPVPANKPARDAAREDVFMREVDDALREDELKTFLEKYGKPLLAAVVIGLLALGGWLWWSGEQKAEAGERGEAYTQALDDLDAGNLAGADERLATIAEGNSGSAVSAKLMRAGIALEQGNTQQAVALYEEVAENSGAPQPYRDLATIRAVAANFDTRPPADVIARLKPLAVEGNPWFGVAGELVGMAYLKQDKPKLAGPLFAQIARDEDLPQSLRGRARQLAGLLGVDALDDIIGDEPAEGAAEPDEAAAAAQ